MAGGITKSKMTLKGLVALNKGAFKHGASAVGGVGITATGVGGRPISLELRAELSSGFVYSTMYKAPISRFLTLMSLNLH